MKEKQQDKYNWQPNIMTEPMTVGQQWIAETKTLAEDKWVVLENPATRQDF